MSQLCYFWKVCQLEATSWCQRTSFLRNVQFGLVAQLCLTLCDPMDCSMPDFPVHYQLPEFTQTHVRWVGDTIQLSHPLSFPSPPAFNLSHHWGLFQWVSSSHQMAKLFGSFSFRISPSNEYSGLMGWFALQWIILAKTNAHGSHG